MFSKNLFLTLALVVTVVAVSACTTTTPTGFTGGELTPLTTSSSFSSPPPQPSVPLPSVLIGEWEGVMVGRGSFSGSGRTVSLIINNLISGSPPGNTEKWEGFYVRKPFKTRGFRSDESKDKIEGELYYDKNGLPTLKWRGDAASANAEFEFVLKDGKLFGIRDSGHELHEVVMHKK